MNQLPTMSDLTSRPASSRQAIRDYVQRVFTGRFTPGGEDDGGGKLSILFTEFATQLKFAFIPSGQFMMGLSVEEENAARRINPAPRIDAASMRPTRLRNVNAFLMSVTPVLIGDWLRLGGQLEGYPGYPTCPVSVSKRDAHEFLVALGGRLLKEDEWEYAIRAGTSTLFVWGNQLLSESELAGWLDIDFRPERSHASNGFGLQGLFAAEWCSNLFAPDYRDTSPPRDGEYVIRGGGSVFWPWQGAEEWVWCISANRSSSAELFEGLSSFRVVYDIP